MRATNWKVPTMPRMKKSNSDSGTQAAFSVIVIFHRSSNALLFSFLAEHREEEAIPHGVILCREGDK